MCYVVHKLDWKLFGVHFRVHKFFEEGVMSFEEKFGGKFYFRVCERKKKRGNVLV